MKAIGEWSAADHLESERTLHILTFDKIGMPPTAASHCKKYNWVEVEVVENLRKICLQDEILSLWGIYQGGGEGHMHHIFPFVSTCDVVDGGKLRKVLLSEKLLKCFRSKAP